MRVGLTEPDGPMIQVARRAIRRLRLEEHHGGFALAIAAANSIRDDDRILRRSGAGELTAVSFILSLLHGLWTRCGCSLLGPATIDGGLNPLTIRYIAKESSNAASGMRRAWAPSAR